MISQASAKAPRLAVFTFPHTSPVEALEVQAPCSTSGQLLELFEEITGWESKFEESNSSFKHRSQPGMAAEPAQGTFSIIDMSADWPANKLTSHRGKCDQIVGLISDLVSDLQAAKLELSKTRSALAAYSVEPVADPEEVLVDSFVPKYDRIELSNVASGDDFGLQQTAVEQTRESDNEFEVRQEFSSGTLVSLPFEGWTLGGSTGIVESTYLDWLIDDRERIAISTGKIESAFGDGDAESILKVDPITSEYRVAAKGGLKSFLLWDCVSGALELIEASSQWARLKVGDAIVATTDSKFDFAAVSTAFESGESKATSEQIANWVSDQLDGSERVMVVKRS